MAASSALALAAARPATYENPFGLSGAGSGSRLSGLGGAQGFTMLNQPQPPRGQQTQTSPTQTSVIPIPTSPATTPGAAAAPTAVMNKTFDLQTDPALQMVDGLAGLSDQQAQAQALQERQQQLLQYGDPKLAAAVLGQNDPTVTAAGQNQESQIAMLGRQRDKNLHDFETQLDPSLTFSGYKVGQEQQLGQAYQDALAQAAAGVQGNLGTITGDLNAALAQNNTNRENALSQAEANQMALILQGLGGGSTWTTDAGAPEPVGSPSPIPAGPPVSGGNAAMDQMSLPAAAASRLKRFAG